MRFDRQLRIDRITVIGQTLFTFCVLLSLTLLLFMAWGTNLLVCICDLPLAARLFKKHEDSLRGVSQDLVPLFGDQFVRVQSGAKHARCRKALKVTQKSSKNW